MLLDRDLCLDNLRDFVEPGHRFFASFFEGEPELGADHSHSHENLFHTRESLAALAGDRWQAHYIGDWGHPRNQKMMRYTAC